MKTLITTFAFLTLLTATPALAEHPDHGSGHNHEGLSVEKTAPSAEDAACEDTINVKVDGLVCDFCARALEKVFGKRDDVSGIHVDLDNGLVAVDMKAGQTIDDETLTTLITDSGYNVREIQKGC